MILTHFVVAAVGSTFASSIVALLMGGRKLPKGLRNALLRLVAASGIAIILIVWSTTQ